MFSPHSSAAVSLSELRARIARIEQGDRPVRSVLPFGLASIDDALPGGGLMLAALHEAVGAGPDVEHGAAAALLIGGILARLAGPVLWVIQQPDLFAPGLAGVGLDPDRVVFVAAGKQVLPVMEEGLRQPGLAAVVGEVGKLSMVASRRLQLAAEQGGQLAFLLRRSRRFNDPALEEPSAAVTRWRVAALPTPPPLSEAPDVPGLGPARWRLELRRCRSGEGSWIVEACDAQGRLGLPAEFRDGPAEASVGARHDPDGSPRTRGVRRSGGDPGRPKPDHGSRPPAGGRPGHRAA